MWKLLAVLVLLAACPEGAAAPPGPAPTAATPAAGEAPTPRFEEGWRACASAQDCTVISTYCGGIAGVSRAAQARAQRYFDEIGGMKKCPRREPLALPDPACVDGRCQPDPRFPR